MPILILIGFAFTALSALWVVQICALWAVGEGLVFAPPFRYRHGSRLVRWSLKLARQAILLAVILLYPQAIGRDPADYLSWLPAPHWAAVIRVAALTVGVFAVQQAVLIWTGMVEVNRRHSLKKTARKILRGCVTPMPLAIMEEAVFRGILLNQLLDSMGPSRTGVIGAIVVSSILFAAAHFLKPQKRTVLPAIGLFLFGILLAIAYLVAGRSCWLPIAIHAGGVWIIQMMKPLVAYRGPPLLSGYRSYPMCGAFGIGAMLVLAALIMVTGGS